MFTVFLRLFVHPPYTNTIILLITSVVFCRYQITGDDVMRSINDTANSAVRAGLIVSQERKPSCGSGTMCVMHS